METQICQPHLSLPSYQSCQRHVSPNANGKVRLRIASWPTRGISIQTNPSRPFVNTYSATSLKQPTEEGSIIQTKSISTMNPYQNTEQPNNNREQLVSTSVLLPLHLSNTIHEQLQDRISIQYITRECTVCAIDKPVYEFQGKYSDGCLHAQRTVCDSCIYENIKHLVENTSIYDEQVTCPEQNCNGTFNFETIRHLLLSTGKNHIVFEQYDDHLIHRRLEQMTEFVWCAHECGSGQLHDLEGSSSQEVICIKCKQRTCFTHRTIWHTGLTCADYDLFRSQVTDDASHTWLEQNTKRCPQCRWYIEKNAGCHQMKCHRCQHKFCWECLVDYRIILSQGRSKHQPSCSHYKPSRADETRRWCAVQ